MSSEQDVTPEAAEATAPPPKKGRGLSSRWFGLIGLVIILNIVAFILVPPFPKGGAPGDECAFPVCYINGTLEFPFPHVVWAPQGSTPPKALARKSHRPPAPHAHSCSRSPARPRPR